MARWCLTVRRVRFLAISCGGVSSVKDTRKKGEVCVWADLRDTLLMHTPEEDGPGNSTGVLALEEQ